MPAPVNAPLRRSPPRRWVLTQLQRGRPLRNQNIGKHIDSGIEHALPLSQPLRRHTAAGVLPPQPLKIPPRSREGPLRKNTTIASRCLLVSASQRRSSLRGKGLPRGESGGVIPPRRTVTRRACADDRSRAVPGPAAGLRTRSGTAQSSDRPWLACWREEGLLRAELGVHLVADERACPDEQATSDELDGCQHESDADQQSVKSSCAPSVFYLQFA
jgi:hypothetical protein